MRDNTANRLDSVYQIAAGFTVAALATYGLIRFVQGCGSLLGVW